MYSIVTVLWRCNARAFLGERQFWSLVQDESVLGMQGSVLYSNYGYKSNEELILGYGFALANNPANFFHVMIGLADKPNPGIAAVYTLAAA